MYSWTFQLRQNSDWVEVWGRWTNRLVLRASGLQGKQCNTTSEYITITVLLYIHVYMAFDKHNFLIWLIYICTFYWNVVDNWIIDIDVLFNDMFCISCHNWIIFSGFSNFIFIICMYILLNGCNCMKSWRFYIRYLLNYLPPSAFSRIVWTS